MSPLCTVSSVAACMACTCRRALPRASQPADAQPSTLCMYIMDRAARSACNQSLDTGTMLRDHQKRIKAKVIWEWLEFRARCICALSNLPTKRPEAAASHASIPNGRSVIDYDSRSSRSNVLQPRSSGLKGLIEIIKVFHPQQKRESLTREGERHWFETLRTTLCTSCR